jgi:DNA-binding transcriptional ArsR family regulator
MHAPLDNADPPRESFNLMVEYRADLSDVYAALGSDVRRSILDRLARGEARITDVAAPFGISFAAVSKHVAVLERAGLLRRRVEGRTHWLALEAAPLLDAEAWIERTRSFWNGRLDALEDLLRTDEKRRR